MPESALFLLESESEPESQISKGTGIGIREFGPGIGIRINDFKADQIPVFKFFVHHRSEETNR